MMHGHMLASSSAARQPLVAMHEHDLHVRFMHFVQFANCFAIGLVHGHRWPGLRPLADFLGSFSAEKYTLKSLTQQLTLSHCLQM